MQNAEVSVFFLCILPIDSRQFDRPTMVDYAGILLKSTVRINKFQIRFLCILHKNSRNCGHPVYATPYAPISIAGRKRQCGPEFPLTRPYANFSLTSVPLARICHFPKTKLAEQSFDKNKKICYNVKKTLL